VVSGIEEKRTTNFVDIYPLKLLIFEGAEFYNPVWDFYFALDIRKHLSSVQGIRSLSLYFIKFYLTSRL
jgi:hypothetical protein